jgi:hypothetical protein
MRCLPELLRVALELWAVLDRQVLVALLELWAVLDREVYREKRVLEWLVVAALVFLAEDFRQKLFGWFHHLLPVTAVQLPLPSVQHERKWTSDSLS